MRTLAALAVPALFVSPALAQTFPDPDFSQAKNCYEATEIAHNYTGAQNQMTQAGYLATEICVKEFENNEDLMSFYVTLADKCVKVWGNREGSLYRTVTAYCHLNAARFVVGLLDVGER